MTAEEIAKEINKLEGRKKMQEGKMIGEAVVIMHPKQKKIVADLGMKYVTFSEACEEDKIYLVKGDQTSDEKLEEFFVDLAQAIRDYQDNFGGIIERGEEECQEMKQ